RSAKGYALHWYRDKAGNIDSVLIVNDGGKLELRAFDASGKDTSIKTWEKREQFPEGRPNYLPVALSDEPHVYYSLNLNEREERTVYRVNFSTNESSLAYQTSS